MCAIGTVLVALCGLAASLRQLILLRFATGLAGGWVIPISLASVGDVIPYERRQPILGRYLTGQILGQLSGPGRRARRPHGLAQLSAVFAGLGFYMLHNTLQTNATQMTPQARGTAVAIFSSAIFIGQPAGVAAGSLVIDRLGAVPLFIGSAFALPLLAVWFARELRRHHAVK